MSSSYMPADAAVAINDMLDCCAVVQPGQNVLILAAVDGLHGGRVVRRWPNLLASTAVFQFERR